MTITADTHLAFAGPAALAAMVRDGQVHPRELVELSLRRIESLDPQLNAFRVVLAEQALAEADTVDYRSGSAPLAFSSINGMFMTPVSVLTVTSGMALPLKVIVVAPLIAPLSEIAPLEAL